jgi:hypothetical protein
VLRLREEGTFAAVLEWTRESRDALATTRDSDPDTGWLPTPGEAALAELDLAPFTGRPIAVRAIEMEWAGPAPEIEVRVRDACGGGLVARSRGSARVALSDVCGSCIELAVRAETGARLVSLGVESADGAIALPPLVAAPPAVPAISHRDLGVIEGFYGQPWDWDERARMVDALGRAGLGLYVYAPKDDQLHRAEWRTPYPADFVARFGELAALAEARGVRAVIALSPFIDFDPGAASDLDAIVAKLRAFVEAGAGGIALFADDIEFDSDRPIDGALGRVHVDAVNAVLAALRDTEPDVRMWFVGTVYSDERLATWANGADYLRALRGLDPGVSVLWTGPGTFSPSLAGSDLVAASELVGRPVAIWDNHWANDGGDAVFGRILLGTYGARDRDLLTVPRSVVNNPMIQGSLSRLAVGTFAAWAADPTLDAAGMRARSAAAELAFGGGAGDDALLVRLMETLDGSNAGEPSDRTLAAVLGRITAALTAGEAPATDDVVLALDRLASARTRRNYVTRAWGQTWSMSWRFPSRRSRPARSSGCSRSSVSPSCSPARTSTSTMHGSATCGAPSHACLAFAGWISRSTRWPMLQRRSRSRTSAGVPLSACCRPHVGSESRSSSRASRCRASPSPGCLARPSAPCGSCGRRRTPAATRPCSWRRPRPRARAGLRERCRSSAALDPAARAHRPLGELSG